MGGKNKQRTKNNAKPSSSGRSAELLGSAKLELAAAGPGSALPALFPSLAGVASAALDPALTPEFALCFKKLNKKDPITKTKALVELTELVGRSPADEVVAAVPGWARCYRALAADPDRRVREATQGCHGAVALASGRRLAPSLKQLVPAWLCSQYDDHAPAQARAQHSLQTTFPEGKLPEVLWFCREEVLAHLRECLAGAGPTTVNKLESAEEAAAAGARRAASALQGLQFVLQRLPEAEAAAAWLREQLAPLLREAAFWKLASHTDPVVRAAWYSALGAAVARLGAGALDAKLGRQALRLAAGAREPAALPAAAQWACLLQIMHHVEGWHEWLEQPAALRKRILDVLETGGWGDARRLAELLLPLLALLPQELRSRDFYEAFFEAACTGLERKSVLSCRRERQAWVGGLAECLRYVSLQRDAPTAELVTAAHRRWLEAALAPRTERPHLVRACAAAMADLLRFWLRQAAEQPPAPAAAAHFDQLVRNFWQNVASTLAAQIERAPHDPEQVTALMDAHILLLRTLRTAFLQEHRGQRSITFDGDEVGAGAEAGPVPAPPCAPAELQRYMHNLNEVVESVCAQYLELARAKRFAAVLPPLLGALREFDGERLVAGVARRVGAGCPLGLYERVVRGWLAAREGDAMRGAPAAGLAFALMAAMPEPQRDEVFNSFDLLDVDTVIWCLQVCLSHPARAWPATRRWARGRAAHQALLALADRAAGDAAARDLLLLCLAHEDSGELLVSEATLGTIVDTVRESVSQPMEPLLEPSALLAAQLASALAGAGSAGAVEGAYAELLLNLFNLNLMIYRGDSSMALETWCEVRASWQDGLAALPEGGRAQARRRAVALMHQRLLDSMDHLDIVKIDHIASLCPYLLQQSEESQPPDVAEVVALTRLVLAPPPPAPPPPPGPSVHLCALRHDCVASNLNCPFDDDNEDIQEIVRQSSDDVEELKKETFMLYAYKLVFRASYLRSMLTRGGAEVDLEGDEGPEKETKEGQDGEVEKKGGWCDALLEDETILKEFTDLLHDYCVLCALHDGYAFWPHYDAVQQSKQKLDLALQEVAQQTSLKTARRVSAALAAKAAAHGYYWAAARARYCGEGPGAGTEVQGAERPGEGEGEGEWAGEELQRLLTGNGFFHSLQAGLRWRREPEARLRALYLVMVRSVYCAHAHEPAVVGGQFARDALAGRGECGLDVVVNAYYRHPHVMLYDADVSACPWGQAVSNAAVAELAAELVSQRGWEMPAHHWDFATITLCSLLSAVHRSRAHWHAPKVALVARAALRLFSSVARFQACVRAESVRRQPSAHVASLPDEWRDMFAPDTHLSIFSLITHVLECGSEGENPRALGVGRAAVLGALVEAAPLLRWPLLPAAERTGAMALARLAPAACAALARPKHHAYKYLAHAVLTALGEPLATEDAEKLSSWSEASLDEEEGARSRPQFAIAYFEPELVRLQEMADEALKSYRVGEDTCEMEPFSDSYNTALGYLLLCDALFSMYHLQQTDLVHHYIELFRVPKYSEWLLTASLRLVPADVISPALDVGSPARQHVQDMFLGTPELNVYEASTGACVGALACRGVWHALAAWGRAAARSWAGAAPPRAARCLLLLVRRHVAPTLVREQLQRVLEKAHTMEDTKVTVHWSAGEVVCVYTVEDRPLELYVSLGRDHPLGVPVVCAPQAHLAGPVSNTHWLALYLTCQNGCVLSALRMWINAVSARVGSAALCYICYSRMHPASGRLPAVLCYQCSNKFHNECLRQWFATSNKSNCPLCRTVF